MAPGSDINIRAKNHINTICDMYNIRANTLLYYTWITRWWGRYHNIMGTLQVTPGCVDMNAWTRVWNLSSPTVLYAK